MENTLSYGKAALITVFVTLAAVAGVTLTTVADFSETYVCVVDNQPIDVGMFPGGISGTAYTAYPHTEDRKGYSRCKDSLGTHGQWISLRVFADSVGMTPEEFLVSISEPEAPPATSKVHKWYCSPVECVPAW